MTLQQIEAARTPNGGWTKKTLAGWGVPWPPPKGWKEKLLTEPSPSQIKSPARDMHALVKVLRAIVEEGMSDQYGDLIEDGCANPDAHIEVTLTVDEIRTAKAWLPKLEARMLVFSPRR